MPADDLSWDFELEEDQERSTLLDVARTLAGGADPSPWWDESHDRIFAAVRAAIWPSCLVDVETQACRIVGDEFYERFDSPQGGLNPPQWLRALAEATGAELRASVADELLGSCLQNGPMSDTLQGDEPLDLIREYYRLRRRAHDLVGPARAAAAAAPVDELDDMNLGPLYQAFGDWYQARHPDAPPGATDYLDMILEEWMPSPRLGEQARYTCSPHRIEMTARQIRDQYDPDEINTALSLLPDWTRFCIEQSGITGEFAARSRAAALTEASATADSDLRYLFTEREEGPFRRQE